MNIIELAEYCKSIEINCDVCEHNEECVTFQERLEDISPYGLIDLLEKNDKLN